MLFSAESDAHLARPPPSPSRTACDSLPHAQNASSGAGADRISDQLWCCRSGASTCRRLRCSLARRRSLAPFIVTRSPPVRMLQQRPSLGRLQHHISLYSSLHGDRLISPQPRIHIGNAAIATGNATEKVVGPFHSRCIPIRMARLRARHPPFPSRADGTLSNFAVGIEHEREDDLPLEDAASC